MKEKGQIQILLGVIVAVVICGLLALGMWRFTANKLPANTTDGNIQMLQPQGINPERDYSNSQTNLNNSQANLNNAKANEVNQTIDEQEELLEAQSCELRGDCSVITYNEGQQAGQANAGKTLLMWVVGIALTVVILFLVLTR